MAHGRFESDQPICPAGCTTTIERKFFTAPGLLGGKTKGTDATLRRLAERFGYSDISNKNGSVAASKKQPPGFNPVWVDVPKGNVLEIGKGEVSRAGAAGGADAAGRQFNTQAIADEAMASQQSPLASGALPKPRPHVVAEPYGTAADFAKALHSA